MPLTHYPGVKQNTDAPVSRKPPKSRNIDEIYCFSAPTDHLFCNSPSSGIVSLISLAVLSYERYCTMMAPNIADGRDYRPALAGICFSWLYSVAWTTPPLLGWSRYGPEGPGTTCSVDWETQTPNNISYIICLFTFCLVLPFGVILYSYGKLLHAIRQVRFSKCYTRVCSEVRKSAFGENKC